MGSTSLTAYAIYTPSDGSSIPVPPGSFTGVVALVKRGDCTFGVKVQNVFETGDAAGLIVYNDVDGSPIAMDFGGNTPSRPAVMITRSDGEALTEFLDGQLPSGPPRFWSRQRF